MSSAQRGASPYTKSEWQAALAAIVAESTKRRKPLLAQTEQAAIARAAVIAHREDRDAQAA